MRGLFDQVERVQAGETLGPITLSYDRCPRSAGWTLKCLVFGETGMDSETAAANGNGADDFILTIPASVTALWRGGQHSFQIEAALATTTVNIIEQGALTVLFNPRVKTPEMSILAAIRALITGYTTDGQRTVNMDGMAFTYSTLADLQSAEARYLAIVKSQIGQAGGNGGVTRLQHRTPQQRLYGSPYFGGFVPGGR